MVTDKGSDSNDGGHSFGSNGSTYNLKDRVVNFADGKSIKLRTYDDLIGAYIADCKRGDEHVDYAKIERVLRDSKGLEGKDKRRVDLTKEWVSYVLSDGDISNSKKTSILRNLYTEISNAEDSYLGCKNEVLAAIATGQAYSAYSIEHATGLEKKIEGLDGVCSNAGKTEALGEKSCANVGYVGDKETGYNGKMMVPIENNVVASIIGGGSGDAGRNVVYDGSGVENPNILGSRSTGLGKKVISLKDKVNGYSESGSDGDETGTLGDRFGGGEGSYFKESKEGSGKLYDFAKKAGGIVAAGFAGACCIFASANGYAATNEKMVLDANGVMTPAWKLMQRGGDGSLEKAAAGNMSALKGVPEVDDVDDVKDIRKIDESFGRTYGQTPDPDYVKTLERIKREKMGVSSGGAVPKMKVEKAESGNLENKVTSDVVAAGNNNSSDSSGEEGSAYVQNAKERSFVIDSETGRVCVNEEELSKKMDENWASFNKAVTTADGLGYRSLSRKIKENWDVFSTFGTYQPDNEMKGSSEAVENSGIFRRFFGSSVNLIKYVGLGLPTAGVGSKVIDGASGLAGGVVFSAKDLSLATVGRVGERVQALEDLAGGGKTNVVGDLYTLLILIDRFGESTAKYEAAYLNNHGPKGGNRGVIGPFLENTVGTIGDVLTVKKIADELKGGNSGSGQDSSSDGVVDDVVNDGVIVDDVEDWVWGRPIGK